MRKILHQCRAVYQNLRHFRWLAMLSAGSLMGAFVVALVLAHSMIFPSVSPADHSPDTLNELAVTTYFAPERLEAFSGQGFNLRPDLIAFLNQLDQSLLAAKLQTSGQQYLKDYLHFVNQDVVTFTLYTVQPGDNFWKLAKLQGYTIDTIVGCNPHLEHVICYTGQHILLPSQGGSLHQVGEDETLATISLDYAVPMETILKANWIDPYWEVVPGMWLFLPGAKPRHLTEKMHQQYCQRALFRSPLAGRYTSFVGMRIHPVLGFSKFHNGVDIGCPLNTWVGAAAAGVVIATGYGEVVGKFIKIDHQNGYQTLYGHLNHIYVRTGKKVERGQLIGRSGSTGRVTGPHLHFTIWDHGRIKDPMDYLW